jgi:hypothetical protein
MLQHEIDHLDGVEFVDRMTSMESLMTVRNYLEFHRRFLLLTCGHFLSTLDGG